MRYFIFTIFCLSSILSADLIEDYKKSKKVVVVYGENAPEAEKTAADQIYKILELDKADDLFDHIITDTYALKHQFFYAAFHLIIVGTPQTNLLCKGNGEIQVASPAVNSSPLKILPELNENKDALFSAHFGYYPKTKGIGYVRRVLNPFTLQTFNLSNGEVNSHPYTATYISGTDSDGVINAYVNFLDLKMLEGAVIPEEYLASKNSRFRLSKENVKTDVLEKVNTSLKVRLGQEILDYKGWIQGAVGDYAGIKKLTSYSADQIFHLKFAADTPQLMTYDEQVNTVLMVKFKSDEESYNALVNLDKSLRLSLKVNKDSAYTLYHCGGAGNKFLIIRQGPFIFIENFSKKWKEPFSKQASGLIKN